MEIMERIHTFYKMKFLSSLTEKDLRNKICLLRVDLNVLEADRRGFFNNRSGLTRIPFRIEAVLPTIKFLTGKGAKVVILSHRGRPKPAKQANPELRIKNLEFSLKPFAKILSSLLKKPVRFMDFKIGKPDFQKSGSVFLLENLRFFDGEEKNDEKFAKKLASLGDIYVNDAFSVCHRANASVAAIVKFLPSYAGLLLEKEIKNLDKAMKSPKKPLIVILGGAKVSDKIGMIKNFLNRADYFLVGGGMANTFLAAQGLPVGDSLYEEKMIPSARKFLKSKKIILPIDTAVYKREILDIGPKTIEKYSKIIENAGTIIWNGPMGYIEDKKFRKGSEAIAKAIIKNKAFSIIGGGETTAAFQAATQINADINADKRRKNQRLFLSTGGGAMLEYLAGKKLPGLKVLK